MNFSSQMGGKRKKKIDVSKNRRLDQFLAQLETEGEKRKQIVKNVEQLTFDTLKKRSSPKLRLNKLPN